MDKLIDVIMHHLPVIILLIPVYLLIQKTYNSVNKLGEAFYLNTVNNQKKDNSVPSELKFQAYERLILFVERIKPESLILRINTQNISISEFQLLLISEIRKEYEYNLTQQLYISAEAWNACTKAKDSIISIINTASYNSNPDSNPMELSNNIFKIYIEKQYDFQNAIALLKKDIA